MSDGELQAQKERPYPVPFIIALIVFVWLLVLYWDPSIAELTNYEFDMWVKIGYLVTAVMFVWLFIWKITLSTDVAPEEEVATEPRVQVREPEVEEVEEEPEAPATKPPVKARPKRVVVKAEEPEEEEEEAGELPDGLRGADEEAEMDLKDLPRVVDWPKKEPGGVYSDALVRVDENLMLNLRFLLGKICVNCEELESCKNRVLGKLDEEVFVHNFDCKEGLKAELHKARKKREAEMAEQEEGKAEAAKDMVEAKAAKARAAEEAEAADEEKAEKAPKKTKTKSAKKMVKKAASPKGSKKADEEE